MSFVWDEGGSLVVQLVPWLIGGFLFLVIYSVVLQRQAVERQARSVSKIDYSLASQKEAIELQKEAHREWRERMKELTELQQQAIGLQAQSIEYQKENNALLKEVVEQAREMNQLLRVNHLLQVAFEKNGKSTTLGL